MDRDDPDTCHAAQGTAKQCRATSAHQKESLLSLTQGPRVTAITVPGYRKEGQSQAEIHATELQIKVHGNVCNSNVSACTEKALNISVSSQAAVGPFLLYKCDCICQNHEGNCQETEGTRWKQNANNKYEKAWTDMTLAYILTGDKCHRVQFTFTVPFLTLHHTTGQSTHKRSEIQPSGNLAFLSETAAFRCSFQLLAFLSLKFRGRSQKTVRNQTYK